MNAQAAYDDLPAATKTRLEGLKSLHVARGSHDALGTTTPSRRQRARTPEAVQPVVAKHPVTGRRGLFLDAGRMAGIVGMDRDAADALISGLLQRATDWRYEYRHRWRVGDLVIWDNRTVLHKANGDVPAQEQLYLYFVMVKGTLLQ